MGATDRCVAGSNRRIISIVSPMNSRRAGWSSPAGKMSATPPRMKNVPCSSTGSWRENPASTSFRASASGSISMPGRSSREASIICAGAATRTTSAVADATTTRA